MILVYSTQQSPRLQYICSLIFKEQMGQDFMITGEEDYYKDADAVKINYSPIRIATNECWIKNHELLFEQRITQQPVQCFDCFGSKAFYATADADFPFDVLAASFYLLSRYEEYLPHTKDMYGRYAHENALAFKEDFLEKPLINIWIQELIKLLQQKFPSFKPVTPVHQWLPTYDIDIAWSYRHKGLLRTVGGFLKSPSLQRLRVLLGAVNDPFDVYHWLNNFHDANKLSPLYFFLLAKQNSEYDKNILPSTPAMQQLVKNHAAKYATGIHPSWQSGDDESKLVSEITLLQQLTGRRVTTSRQHYIRFDLPGGYRRLITAGITDDYSMGYGSINGFRASVASSFYWYDLEKEAATLLRIHPFCYMDANSFYEQKFTAEQALQEMIHYHQQCKKVNGIFISIWHNNFLGTDPSFAGWKACYEKFTAQALQ